MLQPRNLPPMPNDLVLESFALSLRGLQLQLKAILARPGLDEILQFLGLRNLQVYYLGDLGFEVLDGLGHLLL